MLSFSHTKFSSSYLHLMGSGSADEHFNESDSGVEGLYTIRVLTSDSNCQHSQMLVYLNIATKL